MDYWSSIYAMVKEAIVDAGGIKSVAESLKLTERAVRKWFDANKLPRTEHTGETAYWRTIQALARKLSRTIYTKQQLLKR